MYAFAFSVKPVYSHLSSSVINRPNEILWKANLPLKINQKKKVWLAQQNYIFTKDNLLRRKWQGSATCQILCDNDIVSHLFFEWPWLWVLTANPARWISSGSLLRGGSGRKILQG